MSLLNDKSDIIHKISEFNNTGYEYNKNLSVIEIFEQTVITYPDKTAVIFDDIELSYSELNLRSNRLASLIKNFIISPDTIVGIYIERSFEMIIGIIAILKSGGAYLPLNPDHPPNRLQYMFDNCRASLLLTTNNFKNIIKCTDTIIIDDINSNNEVIDNLKTTIKPSDLCYVIYTSGSTGNPKGVMIEQRSVVNRINWMQRIYPINSKDVIMQKTPFDFDVSVWELLWWFFTGASLYIIPPGQHKNPSFIIESIQKNKVTVMHFVPSMLNIFNEFVDRDNKNILEDLHTLKYVFSSGEALPPAYVNKFNRLLYNKNKTKLINLYGPTETTVDVTFFNCYEKDYYDIIPIGKPIDNIKCYIVNENLELLPPGETGELCISGIGVGRGYINNSNLTSEKFIDCPFEEKSKMYKTGDLARWLPDGNIEYLGRIDNQIKINGLRIELGEIENKILMFNKIKQTAVVLYDINNSKILLAYISSDIKLNLDDLIIFLKNELPSYMVPSKFIILDALPLSPNGKIDRKSLPELITDKQETVFLKNEDIRGKIANFWKELFKIDTIDYDRNFFDYGGTSFDVVVISQKIKESINIEIPVFLLFKYTTINSLADYIISDGSDNEKLINTENNDKNAKVRTQKLLKKQRDKRG